VSGPARARRPTRSDYVVWRRATTRWADDDVYGHMNNATYYELFDTAVNAHLFEATGLNVRRLPAIGVVAETSCRYFREIGFPEPVDIGLVVERVGTSSVIYRIGLFQGRSDEAAAEGRFVHVYVNNTDALDDTDDPDHTGGRAPGRPRHVRPLPAEIREVVQALVASPTGEV
jgi:acyl-CoA thioesterase FadM